ncbi:MAG: hypothetical protein MJZ33_09490 [Paludibacteraceae bacterium]|nr:hypothetical protein [Paludibacteraceae bacterium]
MSLIDKMTQKAAAQQDAIREKSEEYNSLIRVYLQAVMAADLKIIDLRMLPDLTLFKRKLKIATQGRLGVAEKSYVRKYMIDNYGMTDLFFNEIDSSAKKFCKKQNDIPNYLYAFQGFSQSLFTAVGTEMQYKLRIPAIFKSLLQSMTKKAINKILTQNTWKNIEERTACESVRSLQAKLHFSEEWMFQYVYPVFMIAKGVKTKKK